MNDKLLKRLILQEIKRVLKEEWEEEPEDENNEDEDNEDEDDDFGIEYEGSVYSAKEFVKMNDLAVSPESLKDLYSEAGEPIKRSAKTNSGGKASFYFQRHPWSDSGMRYGGCDQVIIAADSYSALEDEVREAENSL
jgi:hypothetical protein